MRPDDDDPRSPYQAPQTEHQSDEAVHANDPVVQEGDLARTNQRFFALLGERGGPMTSIWIIISFVSLGTSLCQHFIPQLDSLGHIVAMPFVFVLSVAYSALYYSSISAMRVCDARDGDITLGEAAEQMTAHLFLTGLTAVVYFITTAIGTVLLIIPGLIASLMFMMAPFYAAHYGDDPLKAMGSSFSVMKRHWTLPAVVFLFAAVMGFFAALVFVLFVPANIIAGMTAGSSMLGVLLQWGLTSVLGYFAWLYMGSMVITIDEAEESWRRDRQQPADPFVAEAKPAAAPKAPAPIEIDDPNW